MGNVFVFSINDEAAEAQSGFAAEKGYELETVLNSIGDEVQAESLRRCCPDGICYVWAVPDQGGNRSTWNLMSEYDLVLAYRNRSIIAAAYVLMTLESPSVGTSFWGAGEEGPSLLICFSGKPYTGEVPILRQMERYLDRDFTGFTRLKPEKCENILSDYGSFETFVRLGLRYDFPFSFRHSE
jgi:hypothetical protein